MNLFIEARVEWLFESSEVIKQIKDFFVEIFALKNPMII